MLIIVSCVVCDSAVVAVVVVAVVVAVAVVLVVAAVAFCFHNLRCILNLTFSSS